MTFLFGNWLWILIGGAIAWFTGKAYLKGRKHAADKKDRQLKDAVDDLVKDAEDAGRSGDNSDPDSLHDDDGFKRD